jgi:RNA polymerase sigma factor CnrH
MTFAAPARRAGNPVPRVTRQPSVHRSRVAAERGERLTDGELVTLALNGVEPAFARLLERHASHLLKLVTRRLRDRDDVLDVVQDTRLAVWRALHRYDAGRPFEAWLTSIAVNKCTDWSRHRACEIGLRARLEAESHREDGRVGEPSAESVAIAQERALQLIGALDRLPDRLREPLILTAVLELRQSQAARELGVTRKAVEMRVRRARQHLERALPA